MESERERGIPIMLTQPNSETMASVYVSLYSSRASQLLETMLVTSSDEHTTSHVFPCKAAI